MLYEYLIFKSYKIKALLISILASHTKMSLLGK